MIFSKTHNPFSDTNDEALIKAITKAENHERLSRTDAENLYFKASIHTLAILAHKRRMYLHNDNIVTYVGDRNINYSNICSCACRFCAFYKNPEDNKGYIINKQELSEKLNETLSLGGTQILLQGGHHPNLDFNWYENLIKYIHTNWPTIHIHAFSPPEIFFWSKKYNMSVKEILMKLRDVGLHSIPGGGAEILVNEIRKKVSPNKCSADEWLFVMQEAHKLGIKTTATMMFGHEELPKHRLDHLFAIRNLQDKTNGFTAFIPWTFQPQNTKISCPALPAPAYLRLLSVSRLILDNIQNLQASWVTMGPHIAQIALLCGANDFGSLMIEENVVAAANVSYKLSREKIHKIIKAAGFIPAQRTMNYELISKDFS